MSFPYFAKQNRSKMRPLGGAKQNEAKRSKLPHSPSQTPCFSSNFTHLRSRSVFVLITLAMSDGSCLPHADSADAPVSATSSSPAHAVSNVDGQTCSSNAEACSSNAFALMFRMARRGATQAPATSPTSSLRSVRSAPELAEMERERIVPKKRPAAVRKSVAGEHKRTETSVSLSMLTHQGVPRADVMCFSWDSPMRRVQISATEHQIDYRCSREEREPQEKGEGARGAACCG